MDMIDVRKCTGDNCPIKAQCYRFFSEEDQPYFVEVPGKKTIHGFHCNMFWRQDNRKKK